MQDRNESEQDREVVLWKGRDPQLILSFEPATKIIHVAVGANHQGFLASNGHLFMQGICCHGELGEVHFGFVLKEPTLLPFSTEHQLVHVSCGLHHTAAVDTDGAVWCWGDSSHGQCGTGDRATYFAPQKVALTVDRLSKEAKQTKCREVHCGAEHTVALTSKGELWSWGKGHACALTAGYVESLSPRLIEYLHGRFVIAVRCGYYHTMALVEKLSSQDRLRLSESFKIAGRGTSDKHRVPVTGNNEQEQKFVSGDPLGVTGSGYIESSNRSDRNVLLGNLQAVDESNHTGSTSALADSYTLLRTDDHEDIPEKPRRSSTLLQGVVPVSVQGYGYMKEMTKSVVSNIVTSMQRVSTAVRPAQKAVEEPAAAGSPSANGDENADILSDVETSFISSVGQIKSMTGSVCSLQLQDNVQQTQKAFHRRSGSYSALSDLTCVSGSSFRASVYASCELWTWGDNNKGQLGHGDLLERSQPCRVHYFDDLHIQTIAAGAYHSMALLTNANVYLWGSNESYQLGKGTASICSTPFKFPHVMSGAVVSAVSGGECHTAIVTHPLGHGSELLHVSNELRYQMKLINDDSSGYINYVVAGGDMSVGVVSTHTDKLTLALHNVAYRVWCTFVQLEQVLTSFIRPLLTNSSYLNLDAGLKDILHPLLLLYKVIAEKVEESSVEMRAASQGMADWHYVSLLTDSSALVSVYEQYCSLFFNFIASSALDMCAAHLSEFLSHNALLSSLKQPDTEAAAWSLSAAKQKKLAELVSIWRSILYLPLQHPLDYSHLVKAVIEQTQDTVAHASVWSKHCDKWAHLHQFIVAENAKAEATRGFWQQSNSRIVDALRSRGRRLLRDSTHFPISTYSAVRFKPPTLLLFSDIFVEIQGSTINKFPLSTLWVESIQDTPAMKNAMRLVFPEDTLILVAATPTEKNEWFWALTDAISRSLRSPESSLSSLKRGSMVPTKKRNASYTFTKTPGLAGAEYTGMWLVGKMHGLGELTWLEGRYYMGQFAEGLQDGEGILTIPDSNGTCEIQEGTWQAGKLNGHATITYPIGDVFSGKFVDGKRQGYGVLKQGQLTSFLAAVHAGDWVDNKRCGYGVLDEITTGQRYMGMWKDDVWNGNGAIIAIDGQYFEGNFSNGKISGGGLLITEDGSVYEGEFSGGHTLYGKGTLTLANGDCIKGNFQGTFEEGIKVQGTFYKAPADDKKQQDLTLRNHSQLPPSFGKLAVPAHQKWESLFAQCHQALGWADTETAWERVAAILVAATDRLHSTSKSSSKTSFKHQGLERIPKHSNELMYVEYYNEICEYLALAFEWTGHPLGELMSELVDVYRVTYVGLGAHPRLLPHAVLEMKSFVSRIYAVVRVLFPSLPASGGPVEIFLRNDNSDGISKMITPASLLYPILLPRVYTTLFMLYALTNEHDDELYWRKITYWNKQPDGALMSLLGVNELYWLIEESSDVMQSPLQRMSSLHNQSYTSAIDNLQRLGTSFCPSEKLLIIQHSFDDISKEVQDKLGNSGLHRLSMDDLFPIFMYVVVRSRIRHLGAEIHFMEDLLEPHLELGEHGIMFTTLKACYQQIHYEKVN